MLLVYNKYVLNYVNMVFSWNMLNYLYSAVKNCSTLLHTAVYACAYTAPFLCTTVEQNVEKYCSARHVHAPHRI